MWKAELRSMTEAERAELLQVLAELSPSWRERVGSFVGRMWGARSASFGSLREAIRLDLQHGKVQVIHATAGEAVRLIAPDGELAGFVVDIGDGIVMFVESREWDAAAPAGGFESLFPCTRFSLTRAPRSGVDLDFQCEGPRFDATREIEAPPQEILSVAASADAAHNTVIPAVIRAAITAAIARPARSNACPFFIPATLPQRRIPRRFQMFQAGRQGRES